MIVPLFFILIAVNYLAYNNIYPPFLNQDDAFEIVIFQAILLAMVFFSLLMPTVSTCYAFSLSGRNFVVKIFTASAIVFSAAVGNHVMEHKQESDLSSLNAFLVQKRLSKEPFEKILKNKTIPFFQDLEKKDKLKDLAHLKISSPFTQDFQKLLDFMPSKEKAAYQVFGLRHKTNNDEFIWVGLWLKYRASSDPELLYLYKDGQLYTSWYSLPQVIQRFFSREPDDGRFYLSSFSLIEEHQRFWK
jgi:hypothetical protein